MIAALPMYDLPWLRAANDRLWSALAAQLRAAGVPEVPASLTRDRDLDDLWRSPRLLLGQTCGYPLVDGLRESVQLVATPHYRAEGCEGAMHRAAIVVRAGTDFGELADLRGRRAGVNARSSNTGMNLLRAAVAPLARGAPFFSAVTVTGSHARSLAALLSGRIDVAALDAVTLAHLRARFPRRAGAVRILQWTAATPGLPLIAAAEVPAPVIDLLRDALDRIAADPALADTLASLRIARFEPLDLACYAPVATLAVDAARHGYPVLQ